MTGGVELIEEDDTFSDDNPVVSIIWAYERDKTPLARKTNAVGYSDERRQRMLDWTGDDRLPLFMKSPLFREFKLCRHLLKSNYCLTFKVIKHC